MADQQKQFRIFKAEIEDGEWLVCLDKKDCGIRAVTATSIESYACGIVSFLKEQPDHILSEMWEIS